MKLSKLFIKVFIASLFLYLVIIISFSFLTTSYFKAVGAEKTYLSETLIQVPYGSSLLRVASLLKDAGIIDDASKFYWYLRLGRDDAHRIQAGFYNFTGEISKKEIAERLLLGKDQSFRVTFKEGETLVDLARALEQAQLATQEEFIAAMQSEEILTLIKAPQISVREGLKNHTGGLEGYLFPDTYFFAKKDKAVGIIKKMHARLLHVLEQEAKNVQAPVLPLHELLTLASIIEKETGNKSERATIASVYHNRLKRGMRLQADPTVIYGIKDYEGKIRKIDLLTHHPYNTYKIVGLPPGPIAAPGLFSIRAAMKPEETNYLYFVSKNDGSHIFCEDITCHNKAVRTWQIEYFKKPSLSKK